MPIEGFDFNSFANDLAAQAAQILTQQSNAAPGNLKDEDKKEIIETLRRFCLMAGEALSNDPQVKLNAEQASLITQFIGEWTFHKSIDLISSKIPKENHEPILQIIAANIFNTAKLAIIKNLPQEQLISLVENKVKQIYNEELEKLVKRGILTPEQSSAAANQSNLNDMVQKTQEAEKQQETNNQQNTGSSNSTISDKKSLKLVAVAVLLKHLDEEKSQIILSAFDEQDTKHILNYMRMSDIENKIAPDIMVKSLTEIKKLIPISDTINVPKILSRFYKTIKSASPDVLSNISLKERENVRDFILDINFPAAEVFSPYVLNSVAKSLEDKINDNKEKVF